MENKKKKKIILGILKGTGILGLGIIGYTVIKEVAKEYDSTVEENNRLREFIDDHDFYKKQESSTIPKFGSQNHLNSSFNNNNKQNNSEEKFAFTRKKKTPTTSYKRGDGTQVNEYYDSKTRLTLIEVVDADDDSEVKANNA